MAIPQSEILSTIQMSRIFDKTVATYKYFWFIGIIDLFVKKGVTRMDIWDIMVEMVSNAWYPVCYFHLSFGKSESLYDAIVRLQHDYEIPININPKDLRGWLYDHKNDKTICSILRFLQLNVPYRFLRPWINTNNNREMVLRSLDFENDCLYRIVKGNATMQIELNKKWFDYLQTNYVILKDFVYWNLTIFLQTRNPNVPNIPNKIIKNETRDSLSKQHNYWDFVMNHGCKIYCIYTGVSLEPKHYELDHFIPWSFVSHNLLWNLMPANGSINSSKSDKLPNLNEYLPKLAIAHQLAIRTSLVHFYQGKILEDYLSLGYTPQELASMDKEHIEDCFYRTYSPMNQIALNMGFEKWNY